MTTINEIKKRTVAETPLLLFDCQLPSGAQERWSTHTIQINGDTYYGRVLRHDRFDIKAAADGGVDGAARISINLANADSYMSQIARASGFKGARITIRFLFIDGAGESASDPVTVFRGIGNPPDEITESYVRVTFTNRMSLQRLLLPEVRIQRRCAWLFPSNRAQREEAKDGGVTGRYSSFFRCGYSADIEGGAGNLLDGAPFTSCDCTRSQCIERGMFDLDTSHQLTRRFGGIEFVPSSILVKSYGERGTHVSAVSENDAKYNDFVPLAYGTAWYRPPIIFARNDGNLTHMEVLLGMGVIEGVAKVVVNGFELPCGATAPSPTSTGWFNIVSYGDRSGSFNADFAGSNGEPAGDPYGSMAVASVVVPNRIADGSSLPRIEVLLNGMKLPSFNTAGAFLGEVFTNNPAWILLDIMRRSGWTVEELDLASFAQTAEYCAELITTTDLYGNEKQVPRFQCNLVIRQRRSAADLVRAVRNAAALSLTYGPGGLLRLSPESSFAIQQPVKPAGSNSTESLNGGWPAYEFGDGSNGFTDILRRPSGEPAFGLWSRSTAESPNRYSVEFQDEFNEYQQDSLSLVDLEDTLGTGQEISASLAALGIPNFNQAGRIIRLFLNRSIRGNTYVQFETGLRGIGLMPGDLITITYAKEGLIRQPFRILSVSPSLNYQSAAIVAQLHDDEWYVGGAGQTSLLGGGRQPAYEIGVPRPILGSTTLEDGTTQFEVSANTSGEGPVSLTVKYTAPEPPSSSAPAAPFISLSPIVNTEGGTLPGGRSYYYAVSALSVSAGESALSFVVRADILSGADTNTVTLTNLSFAPGTSAFRVYRGLTPSQMYRIEDSCDPAASYTDTGAAMHLASPPDRNYDHSNFYWRSELLPAYTSSIHSSNTVGNEALGMSPNEYRGKTIRVLSGKGAGQERTVSANTDTVLTVTPVWSTEPDSSSTFSVSESAWRFAALSHASPVVFDVSAKRASTIHISGRAANVHDKECAYEISPVTRYQIGGVEDTDIPDAPEFGLFASGRGTVEVSGISFPRLENTHSMQAATCMLHYWDELAGTPALKLAMGAAAADALLQLSEAESLAPGALLQIDREIMTVQSVDGATVTVERGTYASDSAPHSADAPVFVLTRKMFVLPFARGFFGSPASGSYSHTIVIPDVRIAAAELFVTNSMGNSETTAACYTNTIHRGIRTLSGGQYCFQVSGPVAIQSNAVPAVTVDAPHAIRDVFATVASAPQTDPLCVRLTGDGTALCELNIPAGDLVSQTVDGLSLPALQAGWKLGLDVISNGGTGSQPPTDLTVTVRL